MNEIPTDQLNARRLRQLIFGMVILLTFEGLARKAAPTEFRVPLFFLKDFLTLAMAFYVFRMPMAPMIQSLWGGYMAMVVLLIPSILVTAWHDPLLAIFGAKQYLLYPIVGFAMFMAFENSGRAEIHAFFRWTALLILPTALLAFIQARLPYDNWLNMSVNGESLKGFSAADELRVSSTFSFVAQYCAFLNAQIFIILIALQGWRKQSFNWRILGILFIPAIVLSCFITGSRGAVIGNMAIIFLAGMLVSMKAQVRNVFQIIAVAVVLYLAVLALHYLSPNSTAAYSARENGHLIGFSTEVRDRVVGSFLSLVQDKSLKTFLGNGLGVMSNGSDVLSSYAASWRERLWTETDFSSTLFEGGYYLVIVWYGFRLFVVLTTLRHFLSDIDVEHSASIAFCQAFVTIIGTMGTLAFQPPIAIWWWLGVGTVMLYSWKCIEPPESEEKRDEAKLPPPVKKIRGRSLYAEVIHRRK